MTYASLVARSSALYCAHLEAQLRSCPEGDGRTLLEAALAVTRSGIAPGVLAVSTVSSASDAHDTSLWASINPYGLGLGTPDAEVLLVGKEAAFDVRRDSLNLLLESIGLTALWQAPDRPAATAALAPKVRHVDFPHEPWRAWSAYRPDTSAPHTGQTWSKVGRLFGYAREPGKTPDWQGWTQRAYLTDLGAPPSRVYAGGGTDTERHAFLADLAANFAARGTRTLLFMSRHGRHRAGQEQMARAFLGLSRGAPLPVSSFHALVDAQNVNRVERVAVDGRVVVWTRHLSGAVPNAYLTALARLLQLQASPNA